MKLILLLLINLTRFLLLRALIFLLLQLPFPPEVRGVSDAHTHTRSFAMFREYIDSTEMGLFAREY